jgi:methionine-gamma-lyase
MDQHDFATRAIHGANFHSPFLGNPISYPIFQTSAFSFETMEDWLEQSDHPDKGYAYSRGGNPTVAAFESTMAQLEGTESAIGAASGMGAISAAILSIVSAGEHIVVTRDVYGGTHSLLTNVLTRFGVSHTAVDMTDLDAVSAAIRSETRLIWGETISNPTTTVLNIPAIAEIAHARDIIFGVDATFTTPYLSQPIAQGADLVAHSATKYLGGHGDLIAGVLCGSEANIDRARQILLNVGATMAPFEAFLLLRGLKTLDLRLERHAHNAQAVAEALAQHPLVEYVCYPGLSTHPQHAVAQQLYKNGGGFVSFVVQGGLATAQSVINHLKLVKRSASLGDAHTLASLPVMTSHRSFSPEERLARGIPDGMIRTPIGLENSTDIIADYQQALDSVAASQR